MLFTLLTTSIFKRRAAIPMLACAVWLIGTCASPALAQVGGIDSDPGDPGTGGKNTIQGRIFVRGGSRLDRRAKVKLRGISGGEQFVMSDDSGAFSFRRLRGGSYTITVDAGPAFDTTSEVVDIIEPMRRRGDLGITVPTTIYIEPKRSGSPGAIGTVDAFGGGVPEAARELYKQAVESANSGDRKKAIDLLKQAVAMYPNFMTALNELGVQYIAVKQYKDASEALRAALKISPDAFHPRLNYGIVLFHLKNYKEAAAELNIAVQKDGTSGLANFYLGRAMVSFGNYDAAETALRQTITIGGEEAVEAHRYLGAVYIEKQDSARAADELETYLKLAPKARDADRIRGIVKDLRSQATAPNK